MQELDLGVDKIEALKEMGVRLTLLFWAREDESFVSVVLWTLTSMRSSMALMLAKQIS